ncbi:DUF1161 domain-containing protein [Rhodoferax aquaticus]|jgi:hypothetical protein|uniref:DUF1161 domain-containing protein n=1 Tax=Rhodoferax aquaticus TaxID=2527691 RepID=A0A515ETH2_9BURK|nr:DUF1161 domain-containing protein [Rhodoferax aquaticus]QDL55964.1 DUF1161 domain-containing protein [Rhodoferax aquaticus]
MKRIVYLAALALISSQAMAAKTCEEIKTAIAAKVESHGAKNFTLEIVEPDQTGSKRVVGTCERGAKRIVYTRGKKE